MDAPIITVSSPDFRLTDNRGSIGKPKFLTFGGSGTSLDRVALNPGAGTAASGVFEVNNSADPAELTYRYALAFETPVPRERNEVRFQFR